LAIRGLKVKWIVPVLLPLVMLVSLHQPLA
jgi:hypothetical protein